mmetsp:Transcript_15003/g.29263  ORF Transcript_15003/g.29263 Transcript_15003/m.29263 type:complete len:331 (-) Transcript_15003:669-1661(-)
MGVRHRREGHGRRRHERCRREALERTEPQPVAQERLAHAAEAPQVLIHGDGVDAAALTALVSEAVVTELALAPRRASGNSSSIRVVGEVGAAVLAEQRRRGRGRWRRRGLHRHARGGGALASPCFARRGGGGGGSGRRARALLAPWPHRLLPPQASASSLHLGRGDRRCRRRRRTQRHGCRRRQNRVLRCLEELVHMRKEVFGVASEKILVRDAGGGGDCARLDLVLGRLPVDHELDERGCERGDGGVAPHAECLRRRRNRHCRLSPLALELQLVAQCRHEALHQRHRSARLRLWILPVHNLCAEVEQRYVYFWPRFFAQRLFRLTKREG